MRSNTVVRSVVDLGECHLRRPELSCQAPESTWHMATGQGFVIETVKNGLLGLVLIARLIPSPCNGSCTTEAQVPAAPVVVVQAFAAR